MSENNTADVAALVAAGLFLAASLALLVVSLGFSGWILTHPEVTVAGVPLAQVVLGWYWYLAQVVAVPVALVCAVTIAVKVRARRYS